MLANNSSSFHSSNADFSWGDEDEKACLNDNNNMKNDEEDMTKRLDELEADFQHDLEDITHQFQQAVGGEDAQAADEEEEIAVERQSEQLQQQEQQQNPNSASSSSSSSGSSSGSSSTSSSSSSSDSNTSSTASTSSQEKTGTAPRPESAPTTGGSNGEESPLYNMMVDRTPESFLDEHNEHGDDHRILEVEDVENKRRQNKCSKVDVLLLLQCLLILGITLAMIIIFLYLFAFGKDDDNENNNVSARKAFVLQLPNYTLAAIRANSLSPQSQALDWVTSDPNFAIFGIQQQMRRFALATLYYSTNGDNWTTSFVALSRETNWLVHGAGECVWRGVGCNYETESNNFTTTAPSSSNIFDRTKNTNLRRNLQTSTSSNNANDSSNIDVTQLHLPSTNLYGTLPQELALLTGLKSLVLSNNSLVGTIPGKLYNSWSGQLNHLELFTNFLTGSMMMEIGQLTQLTHLDVHQNQFHGSMSTEIGLLTQLQHMDASQNQFVGTIPPTGIGRLTQLELLLLFQNQFRGPLPTHLGSLTLLKRLEMDDNQFTGAIPDQLAALTQLQELVLHHNGLTGPIPAGLGFLRHLETLALSQNRLSGTIPPQLSLMTSLEALWLSGNELTGPVPFQLAYLAEDHSSLQHVFLYHNHLTGIVPAKLCTELDQIQFDCNSTVLCGCDCACELAAGGNYTNTTNATAPFEGEESSINTNATVDIIAHPIPNDEGDVGIELIPVEEQDENDSSA